MKSLTLKEYERISIGKSQSNADIWQYIRAIETAIINFGGMGTKNYIPETKIRSIPQIDNIGGIVPIRSLEQAYRLLNNIWQD